MTSTERWARAQEYEQGFWQSIAEEITRDSVERIGFYRWRAGELEKRLRSLRLDGILDGASRILELGGGPIGVIGYLPGRDRISVDPLNRFYSTSEHLTRLRNPEVKYLDSPGEAIPLQSGKYQLVIMENCIDHTQDPEQVMSEIVRLLEPGGVLYMTVNARSRLGYWVHRLLARLELEPGHPHTYTARRFEGFVRRHGFEIKDFEVGSWWTAWKADLLAGSLRAKAKGILFVSEHLVSCVVRKPVGGGGQRDHASASK